MFDCNTSPGGVLLILILILRPMYLLESLFGCIRASWVIRGNTTVGQAIVKSIENKRREE